MMDQWKADDFTQPVAPELAPPNPLSLPSSNSRLPEVRFDEFSGVVLSCEIFRFYLLEWM